MNVHKSGTVSNIVFNRSSKPVDVPRSYRKHIYLFRQTQLIKMQTGFRRKIIQLKTFPNRPNVIRTIAIICKICVYLN